MNSWLSLAIVLFVAQVAAHVCAQDAGVTTADAAPSAVTTVVALNVEGAEVSINGAQVGQSPLAPQRLHEGDIVEVRKEDFAPLRYVHDGRGQVLLYLRRLKPLEPALTSSGDFPWLWVGVGAGAAAAVAVLIVVAVAAAGGSDEGIPIPEIEP